MRRRVDGVLRHRHGHDDEHGHGPHDHEGHDHDHQHPDAPPVHVAPHQGVQPPAAGDAESHRQPLARGAGAGAVLYFDAPSGLAGDMCVAALVDLGVPFAVVQAQIARLGLEGVSIGLRSLPAGSIGATKFDVHIHGPQHERSYAEIRGLLDGAGLDAGVLQLSQAIFARLARAESQVHRVPLDAVHFHEVGAADAVVDIVAAASCIDFLGARVLCSALPMGRGRVHCRHGWLPLPAPATVLCLDRLWTCDADIEAELVTPTGAAIVGEVAAPSGWPKMTPERVGWGRGTRELHDRPNALRAVLGKPARSIGEPDARHVVIEANLDDATGEMLGFAIAALLSGGALDAWAVPATMKKGRPAWVLSALAPSERAEAIAQLMLRETPTIGVRSFAVGRRELERHVREVNTPWGPVRVKFSGADGELLHAKPEFDDCQRLAQQHGVPVLQVIAAAERAARPD